jgi:glycerol-3-phosphate acyltransferase PlsY
VARLFDRNVDLRETGSGNIGATNVARAAGKSAGILTLALDVGKGVFPMALAYMLIGEDYFWLSLVGGAVFLGHVFSIYLRFKGGKGVATALGVILSLSPSPPSSSSSCSPSSSISPGTSRWGPCARRRRCRS